MKKTIVLNAGFAAKNIEELVNNMNTTWTDLNKVLDTIAADVENDKTYEFEIVDGKAVAIQSTVSVKDVVDEHEHQMKILEQNNEFQAIASRMGREIIAD